MRSELRDAARGAVAAVAVALLVGFALSRAGGRASAALDGAGAAAERAEIGSPASPRNTDAGERARADAPDALAEIDSSESATVASSEGASESARVAELEARLAELESERAAWRVERERLRAQVGALQGELVRESEDTLRRERQWLEFTRVIASFTSDRLTPEELARVLGGPARGKEAASEGTPAEDSAEASQAELAAMRAEEARRRRDAERFLALRSLFVAEQVDGLDLLESGSARGGATGPVVLRVADPWGRPVGTLCAERLRLEGSRAGRTLTLVLEDGYERRGDAKRAFEGAPPEAEHGGVRRIVLPGVDPGRWIEAMPELFDLDARAPLVDDGYWNPLLVQAALNELLRQDAAGGYYRLSALAGVLDGALRDVRLEEYDDEDRIQRRLFADRLTVFEEEKGVRIELAEGVQMRDDKKLPFLEGRYRIFLPRASRDEWRAMGVPGLVPAKESPLASRTDLPLPARLRPGAR